MRSTRLARLLLGCAASAWLLGCAGEGPHPPASLERLWGQFEKLPPHRALALAGDPTRLWVAGAAGGHETDADAQEAALAECARHRRERRIQAPCRIYAVGAEIVW